MRLTKRASDMPDIITSEEADNAQSYDLVSLAQDIANRSYSFEEEEAEVNAMFYNLQAAPEEAIAEFNELYAKVQSFRSRVTSIIIDVYREKAVWQRFLHRTKKLFKKERAKILMQEKVKGLRNKELQDAEVQQQIPELSHLLDHVENILENLDLLIDIFKLKKDDLDNANTNLSRQQHVVEDLIGIGYPVAGRRNHS